MNCRSVTRIFFRPKKGTSAPNFLAYLAIFLLSVETIIFLNNLLSIAAAIDQ